MSAEQPSFQYHLDVAIDHKHDIDEQCKALLFLIRPQWKNQELKSKSLSGGYVNELRVYSTLSDKDLHDAVVIRFYPDIENKPSDDDETENEIIGLQIGSLAGVTAPLLTVFQNGIVYRYSRGRQLCIEDLHNPMIIRKLAWAVADLHSLNIKDVQLFDTKGEAIKPSEDVRYVQNFGYLLKKAPADMPGEELNARYKKFFQPAVIQEQIHFVEFYLADFDLSVAFCHNDYYSNNFIYNDEEDALSILDWDRSQLNYAGYDAAVLFVITPYMSILEKQKITSIANESEMMTVWCDAYTERMLDHRARKQGRSSIPQSERELYRRIVEIEARVFMILHHFYFLLICFAMCCSERKVDFTLLMPLLWNNYHSQRSELIPLKREHQQLKDKLSAMEKIPST